MLRLGIVDEIILFLFIKMFKFPLTTLYHILYQVYIGF